MSKAKTIETLNVLKSICLTNRSNLTTKDSSSSSSISKKDQDLMDAKEYGKIIHAFGGCRAEHVRQLVSKLSGLDITKEMLQRGGSGSNTLSKLPKLVVYVPIESGMEMNVGSPFLHLTGRKFLTLNMTTKDACYANASGLELASVAKINLLFKSLEVQVELGKNISPTLSNLITVQNTQP